MCATEQRACRFVRNLTESGNRIEGCAVIGKSQFVRLATMKAPIRYIDDEAVRTAVLLMDLQRDFLAVAGGRLPVDATAAKVALRKANEVRSKSILAGTSIPPNVVAARSSNSSDVPHRELRR
jgi:hypothetical protein